MTTPPRLLLVTFVLTCLLFLLCAQHIQSQTTVAFDSQIGPIAINLEFPSSLGSVHLYLFAWGANGDSLHPFSSEQVACTDDPPFNSHPDHPHLKYLTIGAGAAPTTTDVCALARWPGHVGMAAIVTSAPLPSTNPQQQLLARAVWENPNVNAANCQRQQFPSKSTPVNGGLDVFFFLINAPQVAHNPLVRTIDCCFLNNNIILLLLTTQHVMFFRCPLRPQRMAWA